MLFQYLLILFLDSNLKENLKKCINGLKIFTNKKVKVIKVFNLWDINQQDQIQILIWQEPFMVKLFTKIEKLTLM